MEKRQLNVTFTDLDDINKTLDTLFCTIEVLMLHYSKMGAQILFEFLEQICLYIWAIYVGLINKMKEKDNENKT